jgi:hypothetical protein
MSYELTSDVLQDARRLLDSDPPDTENHESTVYFVSKSGEVTAVDALFEPQPGTSGHFSVAPIVFAIVIDVQNDSADEAAELEERLTKERKDFARAEKQSAAKRPSDEEMSDWEAEIQELEEQLEEAQTPTLEIGLTYVTDLSELSNDEKENSEVTVGAFVYPPTKDGSANLDKPTTIHSFEELREFMTRWALVGD